MTLSQPPARRPDDEADDDWEEQRQRAALVQAAAAGEKAASWVRRLALRQREQCQRRALDAFADTVQRVMAEIDTVGDGEVSTEIRHRLDAYVLIGDAGAKALPELSTSERLALLAVGSIACTAPGTVLGDLSDHLPVLCGALDAALASARPPRRPKPDTRLPAQTPETDPTR
ncbi:hypothetical protein ACIG5E_37815 [Kitasatospora sp. NPDC053057]|uniref:hypothetical protein n=1 Tax=Kitasatospora sp. NPDC053057 TaxID=3364062 RepID=UPI0037C72FC9